MNFKKNGIFTFIFTILSCYSSPYFNPDKPHHSPSGFQNTDEGLPKHGFGALLKWTSTRWMSDVSNDPKDYEFTVVPNEGKTIRDFSGKWSVTWIGHATALVQINGFNVLTDPIWSERCSPVSFAGPKRYTPPGIDIEDLPPIHAVVISHNHYDHMDIPSLQKLNNKFSPRFFVGLGNEQFLRDQGISNVEELDWWESRDVTRNPPHFGSKVQTLKVHFTPTQHFSARGILDRDRTLWGSFVLESKFSEGANEPPAKSSTKVYFAGDTGYFSGFSEIGEKWGGFDLAILPIGAYEPRWFMAPVHVSPEQSVQAFVDLKAKYMLPMHYNTFVLSDEALDEPLDLTRKTLTEKGIDLHRLLGLVIGESFFVD